MANATGRAMRHHCNIVNATALGRLRLVHPATPQRHVDTVESSRRGGWRRRQGPAGRRWVVAYKRNTEAIGPNIDLQR